MKLLEQNTLQQIIKQLTQGELIGLPTETVYGLAADANNPAAIKKIFFAKGRPHNHPLIVHLPDQQYLKHWACDIPAIAYALADTCWPGPLTLILKKHPNVNTVVTGGKQTIGLRSPAHPIAQQVLHAFKSGLAAPSANRFCRISSTSAHDVKAELGDKVSYIIDGGDCDIGIESTIVDLTQAEPTIVRPGMLSKEDLQKAVNVRFTYAENDQTQTPGNMETHYAPTTAAYLCSAAELADLDLSNSGVISFEKPQVALKKWLPASHDAHDYAQHLYHFLRELDELHCDTIYIESTPQTEAWRAINDRLKRLCRKE